MEVTTIFVNTPNSLTMLSTWMGYFTTTKKLNNVIGINKLLLKSKKKKKTKRINTHIYHLQVNNHLVWSTSKHDVYFPSGLHINHWSGIHSNSNLTHSNLTTNVLDLSKSVKPTEVI